MPSKTFEVGGYVQMVNKGDISCSCKFSTVHPYNYKNGEQVCKHIREVIKLINETKNT